MQIHGKEIKTIISDLDGTLLGEDKQLDAGIFPIIEELEKRGVSFVAASGRQYNNMKLMFAPIIDRIPLVCENGSQIVKNKEVVYERNIPRELSFRLIEDMLKIPGTETIVSSECNLYTLAERREFIAYMNDFLQPRISEITDYQMIAGEMNKISIWWRNGIPEKEEKWFHAKYDDKLQVVDGGNGWLDFTMKGVNKGTALRELAKIQGFSLEEALCFGDSENDVAMFHECGISYAMVTGREHVKAEADYICDNVSRKLQEFLQEK